MKNVLIADDHAVTRRGIAALIQEYDGGAEIVEVSDGQAVLAQLPARPWDLILLDVLMPGPGIVDLLGSLRAQNAHVPVLVLTASDELEYVVQSMKAGANGLVHKHRAVDELVTAIEKVAAGGSYLHGDTAVEIAQSLRTQAPRLAHLGLSERELDVFRRIALGQAVKEIGFDLGLSEKTVATYLARIREKTGLVSHGEMARYALKNGPGE